MTETLFILNDGPYGTERSYNGIRVAGALAKKEDQHIRIFLSDMGELADWTAEADRVLVF